MNTYQQFVENITQEFEQTIIKLYYKKYKHSLTWFEWLTIPKKTVVLQLLEQEVENQEVIESEVLFCFNYWGARSAGMTKVKSGDNVLKLNEISDRLYINKINDILFLLLAQDFEVDEEQYIQEVGNE
jgi:hypothetical protein